MRLFATAILSLVLLSLPAHAKRENRYGIESLNAVVNIAMLGDGLYSGFGLFQPEDSYIKRLEHRLLNQRFSKKVKVYDYTNEGLTTGTAAHYLPTILQQKPDLVIVGLGYSDALSQANIDLMHNNLDTILTQLYRNRTYVLLFQPTLPQHVEHSYVSRFNAMYAKLSKRYSNVVFVSEFMNDVVSSHVALDESTGYPTKRGATIMLDNTQKRISDAVRQVRRMRTDLYYER